MNTISLAAKDAIYNLGMEIGSIPTKVELGLKGNKKSKSTNSCDKEREELLSSLRKQVKRDQEELSRMKKSAERKAAESKAAKEFIKNVKKDNNIQEVSEAVAKRVEQDVQKQKSSKREVTKNWVNYTIYYMTDPNAQLLENLSKSQKVLVNGIASYFHFGLIYPEARIANLKFYDKEYNEYNEYERYEINIKTDLQPLVNNASLMNKLYARKQQLFEEDIIETPEEVKVVVETPDIGEIIHPISFVLKEESEKQNKVEASKDAKLNPKMFKRLENIFVPIIGKKNHKYEIDGDFINIHIYKKGNKETYVIDPGVCMGKGKIYLLTKVPTDTLFVSTEHKDIIRKVLSDKEYVLNPSEIQKVIQDYFRNMNIYRYIDMNKTEFLSKINEEDFQKLGKKLTFIINQKINNECRFRFLNWESVDRFTIISDSSVKSPLSSTGETSNKITEGLTYIVEGDNITQKMGDKINMLQIQQYGDM